MSEPTDLLGATPTELSSDPVAGSLDITLSGEELRAVVRESVAGRRPVDARERESIAAFLAEFDALERPFEEAGGKVHVTASAIVVGQRGVVLHKHKRLGIWLQPGGHIEHGETPWAGALREAAEETGLDVVLRAPDAGTAPVLVHVDVHAGPRGHRHLDLRYLVDAPARAPQPAPGESQEVQWFHWHRAVAIAEPGLEGVLRALQPGSPVIRQVRNNDAGDCAQVFMRSRAFALPDLPEVHAPGEVRRWMADEVIGHADVWVADLDGTVVGILVLDRAARGDGGADAGWIEHMYIDPAWIGRGLGDRFVELAKQRNPDGLQLWTFQVNEGAQRFYERHGFAEEERTDGSGNEERTPDVRYRWRP
jgi:8-oxo-dGTP pyrophosphatase MutT (NUDIX family)/GNAT superfamily N-acetyltransferase